MNRVGHNQHGKTPMTTPQKFELRQMREAGISYKECQLWFRRSKSTLERVLRELRVKLGPEQITRRKQYARTHLTRVRFQGSDNFKPDA